MSTEIEMPPELTDSEESKPKRGPGRPRKEPSPEMQRLADDIHRLEGEAKKLTPHEEMQELLSKQPYPPTGLPPSRPPEPKIHADHFKFAHIGMEVWWYDAGSRENAPYAAVVTAKHKEGKSLALTIFFPSPPNKHAIVHRVEESVRHIEDPTYTGDDRKSLGAWELTPSMKALYDLVRSNA